MYDGVLRLGLPNGVKSVSSTDGIAVISVAKDLTKIMTNINTSVNQKTEAV